MPSTLGWTLSQWQQAMQAGTAPASLLHALLAAIADGDPAWIHLCSAAELEAQLENLAVLLQQQGGARDKLPLYGVPFAVKDNIDVAGLPTTAACPAFAYTPTQDASVVAKLRAAGAVVLGKTNLDQFATGLVGVRSPYGAVPNCFDPALISGGSSSGSAVVVAKGWVPFSLGTDTAGSGRVPAGLNNIVGLKPTRGALSCAGVVPACRSLDCVSLFTLTCADAEQLWQLCQGFDPVDSYSRPPGSLGQSFGTTPRLGYPDNPRWHGDREGEAAFARNLEALQAAGAQLLPVDFTPFYELAALLYDGPWVAERLAALTPFLQQQPEAVHPVVASIVQQGADKSALDCFQAEYQRQALLRQVQQLFTELDALVVPTAPTFPRIDAVLADPVAANSKLGTYTNFVNLADLSALAVPGLWREDGLPFGITFIAPAWHEPALLALGVSWQAQQQLPLGATNKPLPSVTDNRPPDKQREPPAPGMFRIAVVGAHLKGMPLHHELSSRGAQFCARTETAPCYRLYALAGTQPPKPGLVRTNATEGAAIALELWDMPASAFAGFMAGIPAPLGIGTLLLADGSQVNGFICEPAALHNATDITHYGGWRAYRAAMAAES